MNSLGWCECLSCRWMRGWLTRYTFIYIIWILFWRCVEWASRCESGDLHLISLLLKIITLEEKWTKSLIASQQALIDRTQTLLVIQNKKYWLLHFILIHYQVYNWNILCRRVNLNSLSQGFYSLSLKLTDERSEPVMFRGYQGDFHSPPVSVPRL